VFGFYSLIKAVCERLSICRRSERGSIEPRRERLRIAVRGANAEIQPGNYFGRFDRVDNIARLVGFFIAWWVFFKIAFSP
jgi:hypothetical protein